MGPAKFHPERKAKKFITNTIKITAILEITQSYLITYNNLGNDFGLAKGLEEESEEAANQENQSRLNY